MSVLTEFWWYASIHGVGCHDVHTVLYFSIYLALLTAWALQKCSRLQHWYWVGVKTPKRYRQMQVKDLPKVPTWRLEWDSNLQPSGWKAPNLPLSHHTPHIFGMGHESMLNIEGWQAKVHNCKFSRKCVFDIKIYRILCSFLLAKVHITNANHCGVNHV